MRRGDTRPLRTAFNKPHDLDILEAFLRLLKSSLAGATLLMLLLCQLAKYRD